MRGILGGVILAAGVGALGWWGSADHARDMEEDVTEEAAFAVRDTVHSATTTVSGRDIIVSGIADTEAERDAILARLNDVDGRRIVRDELTVLPVASPYTFSAANGEDGFTATGFAPTATDADTTTAAYTAGPVELDIASGAPAGWTATTVAVAEAGAVLQSYDAQMVDEKLIFRGLAATPAEADVARDALSAIPAGFTQDVEIELFDDGLPFALAVDYTRGAEAVAGGKLPVTMTADALAPLEATVATDGLNIARIPSEDGQWPDGANTFIGALAALKTGKLSIADRDGTLTGMGTRAEVAAAEAALAALPESFTATTDLTFVDDGVPIQLSAEKGETIILNGKLPFGTEPSAFGLDAFGDVVSVAEIDARSAAFTALAQRGFAALGEVESGSLSVSDGDTPTLVLMGTVGTPAEIEAIEASLADAPGNVTLDLTARDDGTPLRLAAAKTADGVTASGKLPLGSAIDLDGVPQAAVSTGPEGFDGAATAGLGALGALPIGELSVRGTTVTLTGSGTRAQIATALDQLAALPAGFTAETDLRPLDDGLPLGLTAEKTGDTVTMFGKMPFGADPATLGLDAFGEAMIVAEVDAKAPDFTAASQAGLRALAALDSGQLVVEDAEEAGGPPRVTLTGEVAEAARADVNAAFADLPEGIAPVIDVVFVQPDPSGFDLSYSAADGASVSGTLPADLSVDDIADRLGVPVDMAATQGEVPDAAAFDGLIEPLAGWLPEVQTLNTSFGDGALSSLSVAPAPGVDAELLAAGLEADTGVAPAVTEPTLPDVGAERVNVTTGRSERFFGTAWLPVFDFTPSLARCDEETRNILNSTRVNFVTGSARLDARSVRAVNALSGAALHCLETAPNLTIEVGGHTDSQGSEEGNQALSLERADAVVAAMIARGVPESALTAQGYGEAQPIADNETPEGRAANRRTTLLWSEN